MFQWQSPPSAEESTSRNQNTTIVLSYHAHTNNLTVCAQ